MKYAKTALLSGCLILTLSATGCREPQLLSHTGKAQIELPAAIQNAMKAENMAKDSPILLRVFKEESQLEVWKRRRNGTYGLIATYDICKWSGKLGPKFVEGDRQAPEGFYSVRPGQMNPNSKYYLAFDIGFPNAYDRINGRSGQHLMVHGACSSAGCYSMTDENIAQIYAFGRDSFKGGQQEFHIHAFPFRMTAANMQRYQNDPNYPFWSMLKEGYDIFEISKVPPKVDVCEKRYVFNRTSQGQPTLAAGGQCPPPPSHTFTTAYAFEKEDKTMLPALMKGLKPKGKAPAPSIQGMAEARLVADWSRRRARGEKVPTTPPTLSTQSEKTNNISNDAVTNRADNTEETIVVLPASKPEMTFLENTGTQQTNPQQEEGLIKKKKGWSLFGRKRP